MIITEEIEMKADLFRKYEVEVNGINRKRVC